MGNSPSNVDLYRLETGSSTPLGVPKPEAPDNLKCATPEGGDRTCKCTWSAPADSNPPAAGYEIRRDGAPLNPGAALSLTSYHDLSGSLVYLRNYKYEARSVDTSGNFSDSVSATCAPEDLKPPAKIDNLAPFLQKGKYGADFEWSPLDEPDVAGYNIYSCKQESESDCTVGDDYSKLNYFMIRQPDPPETIVLSDDEFAGGAESDWCFYVGACDDCDTLGTCPSRTGPNCSSFDPDPLYTKCMTVTTEPDADAPAAPSTPTAVADKTTGSCSLKWPRVCASESGAPFADCDSPTPEELAVYYLVRTEGADGDCSAAPTPDPYESFRAARLGNVVQLAFTDTGLEDGKTYCYFVFALDYARNASAASPPAVCPSDICKTTPEVCTFKITLEKQIVANVIDECEYDPSDPDFCPTGEYRKTARNLIGAVIELVDDTTGLVIVTAQVDDDGLIPDLLLNPDDLDLTHPHTVRLRVQMTDIDENVADELCEPDSPAGQCVIILIRNGSITAETEIAVEPVDMPAAGSGLLGGDVGNPNCDGVVDMSDLTPFKARFGCKRGDDCYNAAADFDMDGSIGIKDLNVLKSNFGRLLHPDGKKAKINAALCLPDN